MLTFNDTTYCVSPDCANECGCKLTDDIRREAAKWWASDDNPSGEGAPIAVSCFCGGEIKDGLDKLKDLK